jgi:hypothetical protein
MSRVAAVAETATWYPGQARGTSAAASAAHDPQRALAWQAALRQATGLQAPSPAAPRQAVVSAPLSPITDDFRLTELPAWPLQARIRRPLPLRLALPGPA